MRAGASIGRTIIALVVVVVIFLALALFLVLGGDGGQGTGLGADPAVREDIAAARTDYPHVGGTAAEHVKLAQNLAVDERGPSAVAAYQEYRKALSLDPENADALLGIAGLYPLLDREGVGFKVERALAYCDAVAETYPEDPRPYRVKARLSMSLRGWEGGVEAWGRVLVIYPDDPEALLELGRCLMELGRSDEAAQRLRQVAGSAPDPTEAYLLLAENHRRVGEYNEVFEALEGVPSRGRGAADAAVIRARILEAIGDVPRAREQVRLALRYDGNHPDALLRDAIFSYQDEGDLYNAREALLRILNRGQIDYEPELRDSTMLHLGIVYRTSGHHDLAHRYLDPLVARDPDDLAARFHWIKVRLAEGPVAELIGPLEDHLRETDSRRPEAWFLLGQMCARSGDLEGLVRGSEKSIDVDPGFAPGYFSLIIVLQEYQNLDEIRRLVALLYAQLEQRPLVEVRDRRFHDTFELSDIAAALEAAATDLEGQDPAGLGHLQLRALVRLHEGDSAGAIPLLETLVRRGDGEAIHRLYLAQAALAEGQQELAAEQLLAAAEDEPGDPAYLYWAHRLNEAVGNVRAANEGFGRIADLAPERPLGYHGLARLAHRAGDWEGAHTLYEKAHGADATFYPAWRDHLLLDAESPPDNAIP